MTTIECPYCGLRTPFEEEPDLPADIKPINLCQCGEICAIEDGKARKMTPEEITELHGCDEWEGSPLAEVQRAIKARNN